MKTGRNGSGGLPIKSKGTTDALWTLARDLMGRRGL